MKKITSIVLAAMVVLSMVIVSVSAGAFNAAGNCATSTVVKKADSSAVVKDGKIGDGEYTEIELTWNDAAKTLTIGNREGAFDGMQASRRFTVVCGDTKKEITYDGTEVTVTLE